MDLQNILLTVVIIINFVWGLLIYLHGRKKETNIIFSAVVFSVVLWTVAMLGYRYSDFPLKWCRFLYVAAILIPLSFLYFNLLFPERKKPNKYFLVLIFLPALILITLTIFTNYIITDAFKVIGEENKIIFGNLYIFYVLYIIGYFNWSFFILIKNHKKYPGIVKMQTRYVLIGAFSASVVAMTTNLLLPWFNYFKLNWFGQVATPLWISFTSYAILKYRLMDIRIVARKVFVYIGMAGLTYGIFYLVIWIYNKFLGGVYTSAAYLTGLVVAPTFVAIFYFLSKWVQIFANKYLFFSLYSSQETMAKLTDELTNSIDLNKIVDSIVKSIREAMQLDRAGILLIDQNDGAIKYKIAKVVGFNENNGISLVQDNFLTRYLQKTQKPLVRDELQMIARDSNNAEEKQSFNQLSENMKRIEASLCLPMIISNKLIGVIVLGSKISGDAYTKEDLDLLITLSKQAAIAVDNARLYREVQDFNKTLQQKVDEQTKEIREQKEEVEKAYEVEKKAHEELKKVDDTKTQFLVITNHHLRTPLTAINWYTDLLLSGKRGKMPAKSKEIIDRIKTSTTEEIKIVDDFLNVSQFQLDKEIINPRPEVNMEDMLKQIKNNTDIEIQQKGTYLKIEKENNIPLISADESKLKVAIANIIDNAVKYTEKGGITIKLKTDNKKVIITIQDTGIGMNETELKNIFSRTFQRGEEAKKLFATGKGIGLYLSAKIIEAHHGKIWAESAGKDKGSTFYIELPLDIY